MRQNKSRTETAATEERVQALIIPLEQHNLLLPQSAVAEVVPMTELSRSRGGEEWLRGFLEWRGRSLPVASIERYCGLDEGGAAAHRTKRVAVVHTLTKALDTDYYALEIQSIPHPLRLAEGDVRSLEEPAGCDLIAQRVWAAGVKAIILDMAVLERQLGGAVDTLT